jgi:hypothetical protein
MNDAGDHFGRHGWLLVYVAVCACVSCVRPLRSRAELMAAAASLPTEDEPSDHVLLAATLALQQQ